MKIRIMDNNECLAQFDTVNVLFITTDTFGNMRKYDMDNDAVYHGCAKNDRGTCMVVYNRADHTNHVFPHTAEAMFDR